MRKENLFKNKATKGLVAALAFAMATTIVPVNADAAAKSLTIAKGDSKKLAANLTNAKTSKSSVAKVSKKGKVTAKKAGKATITATQKGKKVTYKVTVKKAPTISKKNVTVKVGNSKTVTVNKNGAKYLGVSFKSSKPGVAKVTKKGKITGVKKGNAIITATVKGYNKTYKLTTSVKVKKAAATTPTEPTEPTTPDTPDTPVTPAVTDQTINQATTLADGEYNNVTITSSVADNTTVNLGNTKINKLYLESGSDYIVDATQAEIGEVEVVEKGGVTSKAVGGMKAPRLSFGNNSKAASTKLIARGAIQLTGTVKIASVSVLGVGISVRVEIPVAVVSIEGSKASVSLTAAIDEVAVKAADVRMSVSAAIAKVSVEGQNADIRINSNVTVGEMTVAAEGVKVQGSGTVTTLAVNANNATVSTSVTTATVGAGVANTTIGGKPVAAGQTVTNVTALPGQLDSDVAEATITNSTPTTPSTTTPNGGTSSGGSSTSAYTTMTKSIDVGKNTKYITASIGNEKISIAKADVLDFIRNSTQTAITVSLTAIGSTTETRVSVPVDASYRKGETTSLYNVEMTGIRPQGSSYTYNVSVAGTSYDSARITVSVPNVLSTLRPELTLEADKVAQIVKKTNLTNKTESATLRVGSDTIVIKEEALRNATSADGIKVTVNGKEETLYPAKDALTNSTQSSSTIAMQGTYTFSNGNVVYLFVDKYTVTNGGNDKSADVTVVAYVDSANTTVTLE